MTVDVTPEAKLDVKIAAPLPLKVMIEAAECLAADFEFLRVDFYVLGAQWLIGELTNSPGAGFGRFYPESFAEAMAAHWAAPRAARARASIGMNPLQRETTGNAACRK